MRLTFVWYYDRGIALLNDAVKHVHDVHVPEEENLLEGGRPEQRFQLDGIISVAVILIDILFYTWLGRTVDSVIHAARRRLAIQTILNNICSISTMP